MAAASSTAGAARGGTTGGSSGAAGSPPSSGGMSMSAGGTSGVAGTGMSSGGVPPTVGGAQGLGGASGSAGGASGSAGGASGSAGGGGTPPLAGAGGTDPQAGTSGAGAAAGTGPVDPCATVTCGTNQTCSEGVCMCTTGMLCGTTCVDTQQDKNNCGACGTMCAADGACVDAKCVNPTCTPNTQTYNGHVTHYTLATSMVACHYPTSSLPQYYGAMNEYDWNNAGVCGSCVEITNGGKKLVVQITDECPYQGNEQWCFQGSHHIDLNNAANDALGAGSNPAVTWKYVTCTTQGNIKFYFDSAVQQYYLAVTPMNHANAIAKMEVKKGGTFTALTHTNYNVYELTTGAGTGMLTFRITDIYNHVVTDTVMMTANQIVNGNVQFATCP